MARLLTLQAAHMMDTVGNKVAASEIAQIKVIVPNIVSDVIDIGKAVSFSGFIAVPLVLFFQHNLIRTIDLKDSVSYSIVLFLWVMSSQIFL